MARAPDPRIEQAKAMYLEGRKLVEIASQLNLPEGTVRRWKSTHKWDSERSDKNNERSDRKKNASKVKKDIVIPDVESVLQNSDLSDKQRLFCLYYVRCFNATKAYQKAYECDYFTARSHGFELLSNVVIKAEIQRLKQSRLNRELLDEHDIFQKYMDIAFADITDFVEFGNGTFTDPETGEQVQYSYVNLKDSKNVDGTLVSEVSNGKCGTKIKLVDRMKALEWLAEHMDLATEEQKARIAQIRAQTDKLKGTDNDAALNRLDEVLSEIKGVV